MLVAVVSDSHDNVWAVDKAVEKLLSLGAELFIHLGDIVAPFTLRRFAEAGVKKLEAVFGNNCGERPGLLEAARQQGWRIGDWPRVLGLGEKRVVLIHGAGPPEETRRLAEALAASRLYDAVLYGHTHRVDKRYINGVLVLNPGELCGCLTGKRTAALLDTETMRAEIIEV